MNILHAITLAALLHGTPAPAPAVHCLKGTVSYKFVGTPGTTFTYGGTRYAVPASGWVELLSERDGKGYLAANGRTLPLDVWPIDAFGTRTVSLQQPDAPAGDIVAVSSLNN